jgi:hypothetical protein
VPFLEQLHIVGEPSLNNQRRGDPAFLAHLRPASDRADPALCPRLRRLELSDFKQISDETIREFIISRTGPCLELFQGKTAQTVVPLSHFRCTLPVHATGHPPRPSVFGGGLCGQYQVPDSYDIIVTVFPFGGGRLLPSSNR